MADKNKGFRIKKCFNCGSPGHRKELCPKIRCFFCWKKGHIKEMCWYYSHKLNKDNARSLQWPNETQKKLKQTTASLIEQETKNLELIKTFIDKKNKLIQNRIIKGTIKDYDRLEFTKVLKELSKEGVQYPTQWFFDFDSIPPEIKPTNQYVWEAQKILGESADDYPEDWQKNKVLMKALDIKIDEMYQAWTLRGMKDNIEERTVMLMSLDMEINEDSISHIIEAVKETHEMFKN